MAYTLYPFSVRLWRGLGAPYIIWLLHRRGHTWRRAWHWAHLWVWTYDPFETAVGTPHEVPRD